MEHKYGSNDPRSQITGREHNYGLNGIELNKDLGLDLYEMPLRNYDPTIARWTTQDPVKHYNYSPYSAFDNNPVYYSDPSGADAETDRLIAESLAAGARDEIGNSSRGFGSSRGDGYYNRYARADFAEQAREAEIADYWQNIESQLKPKITWSFGDLAEQGPSQKGNSAFNKFFRGVANRIGQLKEDNRTTVSEARALARQGGRSGKGVTLGQSSRKG